ncbi:MAG: SDR family oxidoreductase [Clostridiales bacterium]|nr:SDR family oxidoreductase [Clostridiales bacterium]
MIYKSDLLDLGGKVAAVTGASGGIGLGSAQILSAHGAAVALLDVNEKQGELEAEKLRAEGRKARFYRCDVTSDADCRAAVEAIERDFGRLDILHNNAGVTVRKSVPELLESEWDFVLDVTLKGVYLVSKYAVPLMARGGGGSVINTGSGWGLKGGDKASAYCAAKGGVVNLTRAMAIDHGRQNIRVNSVNPGDTDTDMLRIESRQLGENEEQFLKDSAKGRPLERLGTPEDIAKAVLFLASDMSSWMTGAALVVDGGGIA